MPYLQWAARGTWYLAYLATTANEAATAVKRCRYMCLEMRKVDGRGILPFLDLYDFSYICHSEIFIFSLCQTEDVTVMSKSITDNYETLGTAQDAFISFICLTLTLQSILLYQDC